MRTTVKTRRSGALAAIAASGMVLLSTTRAPAADPTTSDCMKAADASLDLRAARKLRDARAQLLVCSSASCPGDVRTECMRRVELVNASIPTIVFEAKDAAGNDVTGVKITMDGQPLTDRLEGTAMSLDPGEHEFVFEAPSGLNVRKVLVLHESEKDRRETIVFESAPATATPPAPVSAPAASGSASPEQRAALGGPAQSFGGPPPDEAGSSDGRRRTLAFALGGAGVAGVVVGSVFGVMAIGKTNDEKRCINTPGSCSMSTTQSAHDGAVTSATLSTVGFVAGGALLAAGALVYFVWSPFGSSATRATALQVSPQVGPNGAGIAASGHF